MAAYARPTSPLWNGRVPMASGSGLGLGEDLGDALVTGEIDALRMVLLPRVHPPIRSITHAAPAAGKARTLPLIFSGAEFKVGTIKVRDTRAQFAPMPAKFRGLLCVAAVLAALGPMSAQAFTLIQGTAKLYVNPNA